MTNRPRHERTPITEALAVVDHLDQVYRGFAGASFVDDYFEPMGRDPATSGDVLAERIRDETGIIDSMATACAYAVEAIRAARVGDTGTAWSFVGDAKFWCGAATFAAWVKNHPNAMSLEVAARGGAKGGAAKSTKSAAERTKLREWCDGKLDQYDTLKDLGDDAHAAKVIAFGREKIGEWITDFAKDWRLEGRCPGQK